MRGLMLGLTLTALVACRVPSKPYPTTELAGTALLLDTRGEFPDGSPVPPGHTFHGEAVECQRGIYTEVWKRECGGLSTVRNCEALPQGYRTGVSDREGVQVYDAQGSLAGHLIFEDPRMRATMGQVPDNLPGRLLVEGFPSELQHFMPSRDYSGSSR